MLSETLQYIGTHIIKNWRRRLRNLEVENRDILRTGGWISFACFVELGNLWAGLAGRRHGYGSDDGCSRVHTGWVGG